MIVTYSFRGKSITGQHIAKHSGLCNELPGCGFCAFLMHVISVEKVNHMGKNRRGDVMQKP